jgi:hypothetical protein
MENRVAHTLCIQRSGIHTIYSTQKMIMARTDRGRWKRKKHPFNTSSLAWKLSTVPRVSPMGHCLYNWKDGTHAIYRIPILVFQIHTRKRYEVRVYWSKSKQYIIHVHIPFPRLVYDTVHQLSLASCMVNWKYQCYNWFACFCRSPKLQDGRSIAKSTSRLPCKASLEDLCRPAFDNALCDFYCVCHAAEIISKCLWRISTNRSWIYYISSHETGPKSPKEYNYNIDKLKFNIPLYNLADAQYRR